MCNNQITTVGYEGGIQGNAKQSTPDGFPLKMSEGTITKCDYYRGFLKFISAAILSKLEVVPTSEWLRNCSHSKSRIVGADKKGYKILIITETGSTTQLSADPMTTIDKKDYTRTWTDQKRGWFKTKTTAHMDYLAYILTAYGSIYRYHKYQEKSKTSWGGWGLAFLGAIFGALLTPFLPVFGAFGIWLASEMSFISGSIFANLTMLSGYLTSQFFGKTANVDGGELTLVYVPDYSYSTTGSSSIPAAIIQSTQTESPRIQSSQIQSSQAPAIQKPAKPDYKVKIKEVKP